MADKTYTVTVASGTLYISGGTGNVFYLDGVRDMALEWVEGATLRFDQSDSSNNFHPLLFTTNTSDPGGNIISSGVTYYLDGASNQASYSNTTSFNAATTRYVEITPASSTDFYYYCYVHGIGMGGAIDVTQTTWGALSWNQGDYGQQNTTTVAVSRSSATSSLGSVVAFPSQGWGRDTWGLEDWGENTATVFLTGQSSTSNVGDLIASPDRGWGADTWSNGEWGELNDDTAVLTGLSLTSAIGTLTASSEQGWGRAEWGEEPWGESNSPTVAVSGVGATVSIGDLTAFPEQGWGGDTWGAENWGESGLTLELTAPDSLAASISNGGWGEISWGNNGWGTFTINPEDAVGITGFELTSATITQFDIPEQLQGITATVGLGQLDVNDGSDQLVGLASFVGTTGVGEISPESIIGIPSGVEATISLGNLATGSQEIVNAVGSTATTNIGSVIIEMAYIPSGQNATISVGSITPTEMTVGLAGLEATTAVGDVAPLGYKYIDITGNTSYTYVA
jgi:hypothetical protein